MGSNPRLSRICALSYMNMQTILIIRACAIGDFVFNLPALTAVQKMHPHARFTLVGNPSTLDLAREFTAVENIYSIETQPWSRLFYEPVPELKFDSAIVWMKDPTVATHLELSGIPNVVRADPFPRYGHAVDHLLRTLELDRPGLPDLWQPSSRETVINTGSGSPKKNWPYFEQLLNRLEHSVRMPNNLTLHELSQYLRRCRAYIGNDSGLTHLAAYLGCPTIALFGPTDPRVWGPVGRRCRVIWKSKLEDITVNEVLLAVYGTHSRARVNG
jgi:heptosyltransferase-3